MFLNCNITFHTPANGQTKSLGSQHACGSVTDLVVGCLAGSRQVSFHTASILVSL